MNPGEAQEMIKKYGIETTRKTLRSLRAQTYLSQQELAGLAGVAQQTVSRIEKGERNITAPVLARLLTVLERALEKKRKDEGHWPLIPLSKLSVQPAVLVEEQKRIIEIQKELIQLQKELLQSYAIERRELTAENDDLEKSLKEKETRVRELSELLGLETEAALARNKADEFREKIGKPVTAPEGGE